MSVYDKLFKYGFSRIDPERAHQWAFGAIRTMTPTLAKRRAGATWQPVEAMGLKFPNVLGLAAGFDKNGHGIDALHQLGFGHVEIGTVTALAQPGNPKPRLFRLPDDRAIVNRMGFNNDGADAVAQRLELRRARHITLDHDRRWMGTVPSRPILGVNIGKSKLIPEEDQAAVEHDYRTSARLLAPYADYLVVNVSSPNTPGLRTLQAVERLAPLLEAVRRAADDVVLEPKPTLVKIAPDLADEEVMAVADMVRSHEFAGVIATNTTISREGLRSRAADVEAAGSGGLSGQPLARRAREVTAMLRRRLGPAPTIISAGGITTAAEARARLEAGANLLQAYSAFVYEGPAWPNRLVTSLQEHR